MDFLLPEIGEGVYEAELVAWLVKPGDSVRRGQNLAEVLTDKATMEVPSPFSGTIQGLKAKSGQKIQVGAPLLVYTPSGATEEIATAPEPIVAAPSREPPANGLGQRGESLLSTGPVKAGPSVRLMARKLGLDLRRIRGTGPQGRILIEDLPAQIPNQRSAAPLPPAVDYGTPGTRIPLQGLRRTIAERMVVSKTTIPHYSYIDECEITDLVKIRDSLKEPYSAAGIKLTYLAFFVRAVALALRDVPLVNATLEEAAGEIALHEHIHIGIAVATPGGLLVPVVRHADRKSVVEIAREIDRLSTEARTGKARREDLRGSTFTVTSVGNVGGLISTPVINAPEVGILGLGKVVKRPVYDAQGALRPADLIYLSFSFDHRVLDGAIGAAFGNALIRRIQNPALLLLPVPQG